MPLRPLVQVDDTQDYIEKCREASERIDLFFHEKQYLTTALCPEQITPEFMLRQALGLLVEDLRWMGISFTEGADQMVGSKHDIGALLQLRKKFDRKLFKHFLQHQDESVESTVRSMVDHEADITEFIRNLIHYFEELRPLDIGWELLALHTSRLTCTERFRDHIRDICKLVERHDDAPIIQDNNEDVILWYLNFVNTSRENIKRCYWKVMRQDLTLDRTVFLDDYAKHDLDLTMPKVLHAMAVYRWNEFHGVSPNPQPKYYREVHRRVNIHHPDVYTKDGVMDISNIPREALVMMMSDDVTPTTTKEQLQAKAAEIIKLFVATAPNYKAAVDFVFKVVDMLSAPDVEEPK